MKFIFHTSHCGSTYLASLLSKSIPTFTEPYWSESLNILKNEKNYLVKLPSRFCYFSVNLNNKKIFLYRNLKNHLQKIKNLDSQIVFNDFYMNINIMLRNLNDKSKKITFFEQHGKILNDIAYLWVDRINWIIDSKNTLIIKTKDLFLDLEKNLQKISNFLEINYVPFKIDFNVKQYGLNGQNKPLNIVEDISRDKYDRNQNIFEYSFDEEIEYISEKIEKKFPYLKEFI
jgi:hypothetical protein